MNLIEFNQWQAEHKLLHYEWAAFCDKQTEDDEAYHERQLKAWFATLKYATLRSATECSLLLAQGKLKNRNGEPVEPKGPGDHVKLIAQYAAVLDAERSRRDGEMAHYTAGGELTFNCPLCYDSGVLIVWHETTLKHFRDTGRLETFYRTSVACTCRAGAQRHNGRFKILAFDDKLMPLYPDNFVGVKHREGNERALRAWHKERGHNVPDPPSAEEEPLDVECELVSDEDAARLDYQIPAESADLPF